MKIKFWDRLALSVGAVICAVTGVGAAVCAIYWLLNMYSGIHLWLRVLALIMGVLTALFGIYLLLFPRRYAYRKRDFVVQNTDTGELRIAVRAIENLVQKCIDMHEEIQVESMKIRNGREGVTVELSIALANNIAIPLAVASLQKQIKQYLVASSGIDVKEVRVSVETTQTGVGESPYLVTSDAAKAAAEAPAVVRETKKVPLHQRLFRRGDQAVTVPEPPKMEETPVLAEEEKPAEEEAAVQPEQAVAEEEGVQEEMQETPAEETPDQTAEVPKTEEAPAEQEEEAHE